jgi:ApbE superfamily uncharacterized protein (UPF0280 family)
MGRQNKVGKRRQQEIQVSYGPMELGVQMEGSEETMSCCRSELPVFVRGLIREVAAFLPLFRLKSGELVIKNRWPGVVKRMIRACRKIAPDDLTPMAAVAGAVADEVMARIFELSGGVITKVLVNNGGDMSLYSPFQEVRVEIRGISREDGRPFILPLQKRKGPYGLATSGWRGRSVSRGIADAVVVVASESAVADAAATHIGNAVADKEITCIRRKKAVELDPASDIPDVEVTIACGKLTEVEVEKVITNGMKIAGEIIEKEFIEEVGIYLQGRRAFDRAEKMQPIHEQEVQNGNSQDGYYR